MKKFHNKWIIPVVFILMIAINGLSANGIIVSHSQAEVTNLLYPNLLVPAGFTFIIWVFLYIGAALTMSLDFQELDDERLVRKYRIKIQPLSFFWMVLNILWIIFYSYDVITLSFITILIYTGVLGVLTQLTTSNEDFKKKKFFLKYPIGLHFGWLLIATVLNLNVFLVSSGLDGSGSEAVIWSIIALALIAFIGLGCMAFFKNALIILPILWGYIGLIANHSQSSNFFLANQAIFITSIIFLVFTTLLACYLVFKNRKVYF